MSGKHREDRTEKKKVLTIGTNIQTQTKQRREKSNLNISLQVCMHARPLRWGREDGRMGFEDLRGGVRGGEREVKLRTRKQIPETEH